MFFNAFTGAREVDRNLIDNARILGARRLQVLRAIVLPSATSWILLSLHTAFGFALIGAVVGEYTGARTGVGFLISDAQGTFDPATSLYLNCDFVEKNHDVVQKLANAFVGTLRWISQHSPEEIAAKMPPSFNGGDPALYAQSIKDSIAMFNADGRMDADGARNVLDVLASFSTNVQPRKDSIDLSKTYTTQFVDAVPIQP